MSIKLASFQGTPMTQIIGFTYLISFPLTELLNVAYSMAKPLAHPSGEDDAATPLIPPSSPRLYEANNDLNGWFWSLSLLGGNYLVLFLILLPKPEDHFNLFILFMIMFSFCISYCVAILTSIFLVIYFINTMDFLCKQYLIIDENLLLMGPHLEQMKIGKFEELAAVTMLFLSNLVHCFLGYYCLYDPLGQ